MEKLNYPCPCGGKIKWKKEKFVQDGVDCGILDVEYCDKCGEVYLPEESMKIVEAKLKEKNLWGTGRKEIKFWKSGNSVSIRLPTSLAKDLKLNQVNKGYIYPEGERKLTIEF